MRIYRYYISIYNEIQPHRCDSTIMMKYKSKLRCRSFATSNLRVSCQNNSILQLTVSRRLYKACSNVYFSSTTKKEEMLDFTKVPQSYQYLKRITNSTRSLGLWEGIESLYTGSVSKSYASSSPPPQQNGAATMNGSFVWETIRQLPEIEAMISCLKFEEFGTSLIQQQQEYSKAITALERSIEIFGSYRPGGMEQTACFALLVEFYNRTLQYDKCVAVLQELLSIYNNNATNNTDTTLFNDIVQMSIAKVYWFQGKHEMAKEICDQFVDVTRPVAVVARTGQAVSRLLLVSSLDDVFSVRDPFRMSIKRLERMVPPSSTVLAASYLNLGIAEMVWAETVSRFNDVDAPLDAAMRNWKQGITILTKGDLIQNSHIHAKMDNIIRDTHLRTILHARLLGNMAYGMLQMPYFADYISKSVEYATESLAIYDAIIDTNKTSGEPTDSAILCEREGLGRTLSLLANCYHLNGNAITAQGLFQSALDKVPLNLSSTPPMTMTSSLQLLEQRDTYEKYAKLCLDWEKRESDAKLLQQSADHINTLLLPDGWKNKSSVHGSLWFWTSAIIQRH